jgi:hypothetical protein
MSNNIRLEPEVFQSYLAELRKNIKYRTPAALPVKQMKECTVPTWEEYVNVCSEVFDTMEILKEMLMINTDDFEKAAEYIIAASEEG